MQPTNSNVSVQLCHWGSAPVGAFGWLMPCSRAIQSVASVGLTHHISASTMTRWESVQAVARYPFRASLKDEERHPSACLCVCVCKGLCLKINMNVLSAFAWGQHGAWFCFASICLLLGKRPLHLPLVCVLQYLHMFLELLTSSS